jgi:hypothetical protein
VRVLRGLFAATVIGVVLGTAVTAFAARVTTSAHDPLAGLTANQIIAKVAGDFKAATSVHVSVTFTAKGTTSLFLDATQEGDACAGSVNLFGATTFVQIGKSEWVLLTKQNMARVGYTTAQIAKYAGKWDKDSGPDSPFGYISCNSTVSGFPGSGWAKGKAGVVAGQRAVELTGKKMTVWVSDSSRPDVLKVSTTDASATFSHYNAKVVIKPPPAGDVVSPPNPTPPDPAGAKAQR